MFDFLKADKARMAGATADALITDVRYVVVDTELTGLDERKDSIVSIGAVRMTGGRIHLGDSFYRLANPEKRLTADSIVIHEITPSDVETKPGIGLSLREFADFCGTDVIVGHFVSIDLSFLEREMRRELGGPLRNPAIDTFSVYEWLRRRRRKDERFSSSMNTCRLPTMAERFGVPVSGSHHALGDAFTTAQLFQRFIPMLAEAGVKDIGDLIRIGVPFEGGDRTGLSGEFSNF